HRGLRGERAAHVGVPAAARAAPRPRRSRDRARRGRRVPRRRHVNGPARIVGTSYGAGRGPRAVGKRYTVSPRRHWKLGWYAGCSTVRTTNEEPTMSQLLPSVLTATCVLSIAATG